MSSFDVDAIDLTALRQRLSAKYQRYDADVVPAWVAEMDFPLAEPIASALHAAIDRSDLGYRTEMGLAQALSDFALARWGWALPADRVALVPDVLTGVAQSLAMLTSEGDGVVLNTPAYPPFFSTIGQVVGRTIVDVPMALATDGTYEWDLTRLEAAFARSDVTGYVLCNPHNPTGAVATRSTLTAIAELAAEHGVVVVSDEIHGPLTLPGATYIPYLSVVDEDASVTSVVSASKAWNIPGLKCGQLIGTARTSAIVAERMPLEVTYGTGHLGVIAAEAAYRHGGDWLDDVVAILDHNRRYLGELLAEHAPQARYSPPQASYLAWIDFRECGLGSDPAEAFVDRGRVALSSGPTFGTGGEGFARLNMATSPAILDDIVRRIAGVIA